MDSMEFVRAHPPFDRLSAAELQQVAEALESVHFTRGTRILMREGIPSKHLYLIRSGAVHHEQHGRVVMVLEEGELFGFSSMLSHNSPLFDVVAEEDTLAYRIPEAVFRTLIKNPDFAEYFLRGLSERLRRTSVNEPPFASVSFATPLETLITREPVYVGSHATVAEAALAMDTARISSVLVMDEPPGIITDRDLRSRVLAQGRGPETPVHEVMSQPLKSLPAAAPIYQGLLLLLEESIHHLPITRDGQIVGVVTDSDLLRHQAKSPLYLFRRVEEAEDLTALEGYALEMASVVEALHKGGLDVAQIGRVVASLNDALTKRLIIRAEEQLGPPPSPYAWIVFGSGGRMEQALLTDQDNALVYAETTPEAQAYFAALAQKVVDGLLTAGFPACPGGYMATNWHRPLADWVRLFRGWVETPDAKALMEAGIFFDFRRIHGQLSLEPLGQVLLGSRQRSLFLSHMARAALEFRPPLGLFRRIREDEQGVDLKRGGIAPIVGLARLHSLEVQSSARMTLDRLEAAAQGGSLSREGAETLAEAFRFLLRLRLQEQLQDLHTGAALSNRVRLESLSVLERRHLKEAFTAIREIQDATALRFRTDAITKM